MIVLLPPFGRAVTTLGHRVLIPLPHPSTTLLLPTLAQRTRPNTHQLFHRQCHHLTKPRTKAFPQGYNSPQMKPLTRTYPSPTHHHHHPFSHYSTKSPPPPTNPLSHAPFATLPLPQKLSRITSLTFNILIVLSGTALLAFISYTLYTEVFSPSSQVSHFNRATTRIKAHTQCLRLLGGGHNGESLKFYGEGSGRGWRGRRPVSSSTETSRDGTTHLRITFHAEGTKTTGTVMLHLTKSRSASEFHYEYFSIDIPGQERIYLEDNRPKLRGSFGLRSRGGGGGSKEDKPFRLFGVRWA